MRNFFNLLANELIKILKQTGYRIIIIALVVIGFFMPLFARLITIDVSSMDNAEAKYNSAVSEAEEMEYYYGIDEENDKALYRDFCLAEAEIYSFFMDFEEWKYQAYCMNAYGEDSYYDCFMKKRAFDVALSGKYTAEELYNSRYSYLLDEYFTNTDYYFGGKYDEKEDMPEEKMPGLKLSAISEDKQRIEKKLSETKDLILSTTVQMYIKKNFLDHYITTALMAKVEYENAKALYDNAKNSSSDEKTLAQLEYSLKVKEAEHKNALTMKEIWQLLYDRSASPSSAEFELAYRYLPSVLDGLRETVPVTEEAYSEMTGNDLIFSRSYSQYVRDCNRREVYFNSAIKVIRYAIENSISLPKSTIPMESMILGGKSSVSVKAQYRSLVESFVGLTTIAAVIIVSGVISSEFSSGTIRLLLIRPRSRRQIIYSKLIAVGIVMAAVTLFVTGMMLVEVMILFGIGDMFVNDLVLIGDHILELPALFGLVKSITLSSLTVIALTAFAAFVSVLTKKTALAVAGAILVYVFKSTVTTMTIIVCGIFPRIFSWLIYTPTVYSDLNAIKPPHLELMSVDLNISTVIFDAIGGLTQNGAILSLGIFYHLVAIVFFVLMTSLIFRKNQIKS